MIVMQSGRQLQFPGPLFFSSPQAPLYFVNYMKGQAAVLFTLSQFTMVTCINHTFNKY